MPARRLSLTRFPVCVAQIACGLSRGLVCNHACNALSFRFLALFRFCDCGSLGSRFSFGRFHFGARLLFQFYARALDPPLFPRSGDGCAFRLTRGSRRLVGCPCGLVGVQQSRFCLGGGRAAVGKLAVSRVLQIFVQSVVGVMGG